MVAEIRLVRRGPSGLAVHVMEPMEKDEVAAGGMGAGGFQWSFAASDIGRFMARRFQSADCICRDCGIEHTLSDPCFEAQAISCEMACSEESAQAGAAEGTAEQQGIAGGVGSRNIDLGRPRDRCAYACMNAGMAPCRGAERARWQALDTADSGPWTGMPVSAEESKRARQHSDQAGWRDVPFISESFVAPMAGLEAAGYFKKIDVL